MIAIDKAIYESDSFINKCDPMDSAGWSIWSTVRL